MTAAGRYPDVRLVPPDGTWAARYAVIAAELAAALGPGWRLEHVGSTSVPGLVAKPVIDLAMRLPDGAGVEEAHAPLLRAGWTVPVAVGDHWASFLVEDGVRSAIAHLYDAGQWPAAHVRLFAAWLRSHPADRDRYAQLKRALVAHGVWGSGYTTAKGELVLEVVNLARVERGLCPVTGPL